MIPFDVARVIVLGIPHGRPIEEAEEKFGFKADVIEQFFKEEIDFGYSEFQNAEGLTLTCMAPYYDLVMPIKTNHDIRCLVTAEIDSYGQIPADTEITVNAEGIWLNEDRMNFVAYHTFDNSNELGVIYLCVSGVYRDKNGEFRELDIMAAKRVDNDNYHWIDPVPYPNVGEIEDQTIRQFEVMFKAIRNDYRLGQEDFEEEEEVE